MIELHISDPPRMTNQNYQIGFEVCFSCWIIGGLADFFISFKYLKSAVGLFNSKKLKQVRVLEWGSVTVFLTCFLSTQIAVVSYAIVNDYSQDTFAIKVLLDTWSIPIWIHRLFIFNLCLFIVFEAVVTVVLITALVLIRRFIQRKNSNDILIGSTIIMNLVQYTTCCLQFFNFVRITNSEQDCFELTENMIRTNTCFNVLMVLLYVSQTFVYFISYRYAEAAAKVRNAKSYVKQIPTVRYQPTSALTDS